MADRPAQRAGALILALVFLFSTVALTGYVIWQVQQGNKDKKAAAAAAAETEAKSNNGGKKLEGTKLADFTPVQTVLVDWDHRVNFER